MIATANARVAAARARVLTAKANVAEVAQQATRQKALVESGAVGRATFEDLEARRVALAEVVRAAEAEVGAAQAEVEIGPLLAVGSLAPPGQLHTPDSP